jgi:hypothetical protein
VGANADLDSDGCLRSRDGARSPTASLRGSIAKAKAPGYRSPRNLIAITYLIAGKIDLKLAT